MNKKQELYLQKKAKLMEMGGEARIAKQHALGKLTCRERLNLLFDEGTFVETGLFAKHRCTRFGMENIEIPADGVVTGFGKVDGRTVYAFAQDFTSLGGALGEMHGKKILNIMQEAAKAGCPIIGIDDGGGARIQEGNDTQPYTYVFNENIRCSGYVPQITAVMGPCAGGASYSPALTDIIFMVDKTAKMFLTGPKVIEQVTGEKPDPVTFGDAKFHNKVSGVAHRFAVDDADCIAQVKRYLSYFPQNCLEKPPVYPCDQDPNALIPELNDVIPESSKRGYDVHRVIELIADKDSLFEIQPDFAVNVVVALGRLNGKSVGFVANQPKAMAGALSIDAADKMSRFVTLCDAYNIPLVWLADAPGFLPGMDQEKGGIIRHGAKALFANGMATVPKVRLTTRKLYGGATAAMCDDGFGTDFKISWPSAEEAVMGAAGAAAIIFRKELEKAKVEGGEEAYNAKLAELTAQYEEEFNNPYFKASRLYTDMIIMPDETRRVLIQIFDALENKKEDQLPKKHAINPV